MGKKGGKISKRKLTKEQSIKMVAARERKKRLKPKAKDKAGYEVDEKCFECYSGKIRPCRGYDKIYCDIYQIISSVDNI